MNYDNTNYPRAKTLALLLWTYGSHVKMSDPYKNNIEGIVLLSGGFKTNAIL